MEFKLGKEDTWGGGRKMCKNKDLKTPVGQNRRSSGT